MAVALSGSSVGVECGRSGKMKVGQGTDVQSLDIFLVRSLEYLDHICF